MRLARTRATSDPSSGERIPLLCIDMAGEDRISKCQKLVLPTKHWQQGCMLPTKESGMNNKNAAHR